MDPKRLLIVAAVGLGLYVLLVRRGSTTVAASVTPAAAVTGGYTAAAIVGAPVPTIAQAAADAALQASYQAQGPQGDGA